MKYKFIILFYFLNKHIVVCIFFRVTRPLNILNRLQVSASTRKQLKRD